MKWKVASFDDAGNISIMDESATAWPTVAVVPFGISAEDCVHRAQIISVAPEMLDFIKEVLHLLPLKAREIGEELITEAEWLGDPK